MSINEREMIEDKASIAFFTRIEDKIGELISSVNEYKTSTAVGLTSHAEKIAQIEEKVKQIFVFHNQNADKFTLILEEIKTNRHDIKNLTQGLEHLMSEQDKSKIEHMDESKLIRVDMKESLASLTMKITELGDTLTENEKKDAEDRNIALGKVSNYKLFYSIIGALAGLSTVGALIYMIWKSL